MGVVNINVQIVSGNNIGGVYPFVVVCFDNDIMNEVHKSPATNGGPTAVWNDSFTLDLTTQVKNITADGKPEPTYLTFFLFDTGQPGVPALGSAGVLLATVRDAGVAKGDFPVVNGTGTLTLIVETVKGKPSWMPSMPQMPSVPAVPEVHMPTSNAGKATLAAGIVGAGALAAGLGAMAIKKKKSKKEAAAGGEEAAPTKKKKGFRLPGRKREETDSSSEDDRNDDTEQDDDDDEDDDPAAQGMPPPQPPHGARINAGPDHLEPPGGMQPPGNMPQPAGMPQPGGMPQQRVAGGSTTRPWWDPTTSESDGDQTTTPAPQVRGASSRQYRNDLADRDAQAAALQYHQHANEAADDGVYDAQQRYLPGGDADDDHVYQDAPHGYEADTRQGHAARRGDLHAYGQGEYDGEDYRADQ